MHQLEYQSDFLSREEEHALLQHIEHLPFRTLEFRGFKRRIVSFSWRYDFNGGGLAKTGDMLNFLSIISRPCTTAYRVEPLG